MAVNDDVQNLYDTALETLLSKVKADPSVLAAVLLGSLSHDTVWRRSDIDLLLVTQEPRTKTKREGRESLCLVESGINIHTYLASRSEFRKVLEGSVQGSFMHSLLVKGKILFCREEPLTELFESRHRLGGQDRAIQLLRVASSVLPGLIKAEKWLYAKHDFDYCAFWILKSVDALATIELLLQGEIPAREVVHLALGYNPVLFHAIYTDMLHQQATEESLDAALTQIRDYLHAHARTLFEPIFDYLRDEASLRSMTEINHHFSRSLSIGNVDSACEWLADEGFIRKFATPVRLTDRSHVDVEEAAFYFAGEEPQ